MIPWHPFVKVIEKQSDILIVYKPCGLLSHPNRLGLCKQALIQAPYDLFQQAYITHSGLVYLLNRLDSPTSGLIVLCTEEATAKQIRKLFKEHKIKKTYQAIVKGRLMGHDICWQDRLQTTNPNSYLRTYRTFNSKGLLSKTIVNEVQHFSIHGESFSLIQLEPMTGRTHQLRVQCALHHFPILGDKTYGDFRCNHKLQTDRLYLHASSLSFTIGPQKLEGYCPSPFLEYIQKVSQN